MMKRKIRIGSRESKLAVAQAEIVSRMIRCSDPEIEIQIITMKTTGDKILDRSLDQIGGKGLFVKELDIALEQEQIDLAVHSLKDMPMELPDDLPIVALTRREDPRDALIFKPDSAGLPAEAVIGTSSNRRMLQIQSLYPGCVCRGIRGNVQTRLRKLAEEGYDGTILAAAGLKRMSMEHVIGRVFSTAEMIPAAGQGILAVQGRKGEKYPWLDSINDPKSKVQAEAERAFVRSLDGGCSSPVAAYARTAGREVELTGLYYRDSDQRYFVESCTGVSEQAEAIGLELAREMERKYG